MLRQYRILCRTLWYVSTAHRAAPHARSVPDSSATQYRKHRHNPKQRYPGRYLHTTPELFHIAS
eukprot:2192056-Rhodomonas_salina.1